MFALAFRSGSRRVAYVYPRRHYTTPQEVMANVRKRTLKLFNSVPQGSSVASVWPPVDDTSVVDSSIFNMNPKDFLHDGKEVDIDAVSRKYDLEGEFSPYVQRAKEMMAAAESHDPLHEVLHGMGMTQIQYRHDDNLSINWDFYKKNIPDKEIVSGLEKAYHECMKQADEFTKEGSPLMNEVNASYQRMEDLFVEEMTVMQAESRAIDEELKRVEAHQKDLVAFGSNLDDLYVEDELAKEEGLDQQLESDLLAGKWTVEDEDIPEPPVSADDDILLKALSREVSQEELEQRVKKATWD